MHIFSKNFSSDELRLIFGRYPCQEVEYIFSKKLLAMHSTLYFRLKHANASRCILLFRTTFGVRLSSRLGRLVCALLRFRERPRTIEVQRTTSSPQNHRKSLAQYSVVLFI